jgi:hypothetical protein
MGVVERATEAVKADIRPQELSVDIPRQPGMRPAEAQTIWMDAIRRGGWVNNKDDTGLVLMGKFRDGFESAVRRADGTLITLPFTSARAIAENAIPERALAPESIRPDPSQVVGGPGAF